MLSPRSPSGLVSLLACLFSGAQSRPRHALAACSDPPRPPLHSLTTLACLRPFHHRLMSLSRALAQAGRRAMSSSSGAAASEAGAAKAAKPAAAAAAAPAPQPTASVKSIDEYTPFRRFTQNFRKPAADPNAHGAADFQAMIAPKSERAAAFFCTYVAGFWLAYRIHEDGAAFMVRGAARCRVREGVSAALLLQCGPLTPPPPSYLSAPPPTFPSPSLLFAEPQEAVGPLSAVHPAVDGYVIQNLQ